MIVNRTLEEIRQVQPEGLFVDETPVKRQVLARFSKGKDHARHPHERTHEFTPGSTWLVYTDQVSHAAMAGQYAFEQTFYLPVSGMADPSKSPLRVLERLLRRELV